ncbi:hypothetical protein [Prosthecobacter algae]|uniref:hypothetical protein n=1 Tax=Prosthecobacter algae TaxID=1144682 RepID=UPI0031EC06A4
MNSIESTHVSSSRQIAEDHSLPPAFGTSNPVALKALRSLITAPQNESVEKDALQLSGDEAGTISETHELAAHFISSQKSPFTDSPSSAPLSSSGKDSEVTITTKSTASSDSTFPDPGLIEALRALLGHPTQASSAFQPITTPVEAKDSGSTRVLEIVQSLLSEETLPVTSLPLLIQVRDALAQNKGDLNDQQETLAQIRALIEALPSQAGAVQESPFEDSADFPPTLEMPEQETPNLGQVILQSLGTQSSASTAHAVTSVSQPEHLERVEKFSALITEMADRVLVTDPLHGQTQEVRIQLAESVMPGTEVRVWREQGGQLRVDFDTTSGYWARVLNEASPLLTQRLNERLNLTDAVLVNVQQQGGQPEDGRSRNRHTPWDMTGQDAPQ